MTTRLIHTRHGLLFRLRRLVVCVRIRYLRWCVSCVRGEREDYASMGLIGPVYLRNSWAHEMQLMARIRELEGKV